ncbi:protein kinase [Paenibacillus oenotherae]|uniref:Protein kinase n=1 Tax=Paenibacillus oenotherae TaxID=1435645 RepID=A0ABS7D9U0_9BACL|nr:protein kinase [Paenibacillus oenotherae]MBW7476703.1 protein kinase [Paenibacillus oenotherae]
MIGNKIGKYKIIELLGSGGNANVYKAKDIEGNLFAVKVLKVGKYPAFNKKYKRFKDEVQVVKSNQTAISGIVPIIECFLPPDPFKNTPWYSMPIATPLAHIINDDSSMYDIMECMEQLSSTLMQLHENGIVHRDIKPNNLYYYNDKWAFGDFGLVEYPQKTDLTAKGESVGPKYTIAPEMKRDAKNSDGKAADIYSLAKTLWILLTGEKAGFEGQYSDGIEKFNISNYRGKGFFVSLHELIEKCTSNIPSERLDIIEFNKVIKEWFEISQDFKRKNLLEWNYIFRKILPHTSPEVIVWTSPDDIVHLLDLISKIDSLNHVFVPGGGGLDLTKCTLSNELSYIELHFDYSIKKLMPEKLHLITFADAPEWNYFYLETKELHPTGLYGNQERYYEPVLELSPGVYVEPYHKYYGEVDGQPIPKDAREILLSLKGSFAFFAKGSTYNTISATYDGRHNNMTSNAFHDHIKEMIRHQQWTNENPDKARRIRQEKKERERAQREIERKEYERLKKDLKSKWEEIVSSVKMPTPPQQTIPGEVYFTIEMNDQYFENVYYVSHDNKLIIDSTGNLERVLHGRIDAKELLKIYDFNECEDYINMLNDLLFNFDGSDKIANRLYFDVDMHRVKKPAVHFTKDELTELLINANDKIYNRVVIQTDGNLRLITEEMDHVQPHGFVYKGWEFSAFENSLGKKSNLHHIDDIYFDLLSGWCFHLECNRRASRLSNEYYMGLSEEQLLEKIRIASEQYSK